ncbi:amidase family protein [Albimonas sp. CAU 1670]|uniref:amidase family protein n=1 Tax=Albimonas sp. CAU 1670 TaxID=3032599 RepID=UPI0023D9C2FB|nr:amidase family protein [Albimonas sp. CAU 1670]MDF2232449.1 amidase family protein [Albimonas sp. CAU 1670]
MTELWRASATTIAARVRSRDTSAREECEAAIARMRAVNPALNAVVDETAEAALAEADAVDAALARGEDVGPMAGVPVTVKINVDYAGRPTTNGLKTQADLIAPEDSPVVSNFRRAGAVVIGRTNTPAFSLRWFCRNSLHGQTLNPHDASITPGGSSGGAGSAVAAGIGAVAHGTDIAGSIRYPAYANGVHGLRPTTGRVAAANLSGADRTMGAQLTAVSGPLARRIADLRTSLAVMSMEDLRDPWRMPAPLDGPPVPRKAAMCVAPDGMKVAPEVEAAVVSAAAALAEAGVEVEEVPLPPLRETARLNIELWMADFGSAGVPKLLAEGDPDASFVAEQMMRIAGPNADAMAALQRRLGLLREWQLFLQDWPIVLLPVSGEAPFANNSDVASPEDFERIYEAQMLQVGLPALGLPALAVATGTPGRPMGVQLVGPRFREDLLLDAGAIIEAAHPPIQPVDPFVVG